MSRIFLVSDSSEIKSSRLIQCTQPPAEGTDTECDRWTHDRGHNASIRPSLSDFICEKARVQETCLRFFEGLLSSWSPFPSIRVPPPSTGRQYLSKLGKQDQMVVKTSAQGNGPILLVVANCVRIRPGSCPAEVVARQPANVFKSSLK